MARSPKNKKSRPRGRIVVSVARAAEMLSISERTVWRLISSGQLETVRLGRATRITYRSIAALIEKGGAA